MLSYHIIIGPKKGVVSIEKEFFYGGIKYVANDNGEIYGPRGRELKQRINEDGYCVVTIGKGKNRRSIKVHRIIASLFVSGFSEGLEVNHKNFIRNDNRAENLEWVTHKENIEKSVKENRWFGKRNNEKNGRQKLKINDVIEIRKLYSEGMKIQHIANKYNVGWTTVKHILDYDTWVNL